ncbi:clostripain-related cysteine peptidase [soil metagenome]
MAQAATVSGVSEGDQRKMYEKEWTIMIYMAGDNNLAVDMAYAMEQIKDVAGESIESPNLFVYYDGNSPSIPTLYCDFSSAKDPRYVRSFRVPNKLYTVPDKANENAADYRSVLNFVDWCVNKVEVDTGGEVTYGRKANRYALIFSGHSLGFQDIGLFRDETAGRSMKMSDLSYVLFRITGTAGELKTQAQKSGLEDANLKRESKPLLGQRLDLLGFDSCVMGMLEVGYQFSSYAKTMIASEGSVPSAGWTYAKILGCMTGVGGSHVPTEKVAERFVYEFVKGQDSFTVGGVSVDIAAWDLDKMNDLAGAFDGLAAALQNCFTDKDSQIYRHMERIIINVHWKCQSYMYDQNVDLGDFCELLDRECELLIGEIGEDLALIDLRTACRNVLEKLRLAVILSGFSGGAYQYSNGISIFFPWSREGYQVSRKNYESLWFAKDITKSRKLTWPGFLKKYLNEVALRRSEPTTAEGFAGPKYRYHSGIKFDPRAEMDALGNFPTRLAGQEGSKLAGQEGSKLAGQEGSKLAGGGGSNAFFDNLRLFKNIESRWNISGFTKKPGEYDKTPTAEKS